MKVRSPRWDFSTARAHWSPNHEFAQIHNAASTVPAYIEPYLVKVMVMAQAALDPRHEALHRNLDIFIKQEMQHCRQHIRFNKALREDGYDGMLALEKRYEADYERFLATKSLRFNCAYSEGFEAMSAISVSAFFEEFDEFYVGADQGVVDLWKWHLAEEYEHREVAHEVYRTLFGRPRLLAYLYRIWGFVRAVTHIHAHTRRVAAYLLATDRASMTPEEVAASKAREAHVGAVVARRAWEHLRAILSPGYRPADRPAPRGVGGYLGDFAGAPAG